MKRILVFNDTMEMGGTEKLLVNLLNHLVEKGCVVTLLLPEPSVQDVLLTELNATIQIKYIYQKQKKNISRKFFENIMIFYPRLFSKIKGIKSKDYDTAICFKEGFYTRIFSKMKLPKILWVHNILFKRSYEIRSFKEKLAVWLNKQQIKTTQHSYVRFDTVVCVSNACLDAYLNVLYNGNKPNQDIRMIYNAVDLSKVALKSKEFIETLPQDRTNFILITRNSPEKRTDRLINASERLKSEGYNFHVYVLGDLSLQDANTELEQRDLTEFISYLGRINNPYPYILQSKWLLCVSERESFSLTLLEAMALNTPVITTDCGGPADIVDNGKYGILVENSSEGVYRGMKQVLDQPSLSVDYSRDLDKAILRFDYIEWLRKIDSMLKI